MNEPQKGQGSIGVDSFGLIPHVLFRQELTKALRTDRSSLSVESIARAIVEYVDYGDVFGCFFVRCADRALQLVGHARPVARHVSFIVD